MVFWIVAAVFAVAGIGLLFQPDSEGVLPSFGLIALAFALLFAVIAVAHHAWAARERSRRGAG